MVRRSPESAERSEVRVAVRGSRALARYSARTRSLNRHRCRDHLTRLRQHCRCRTATSASHRAQAAPGPQPLFDALRPAHPGSPAPTLPSEGPLTADARRVQVAESVPRGTTDESVLAHLRAIHRHSSDSRRRVEECRSRIEQMSENGSEEPPGVQDRGALTVSRRGGGRRSPWTVREVLTTAVLGATAAAAGVLLAWTTVWVAGGTHTAPPGAGQDRQEPAGHLAPACAETLQGCQDQPPDSHCQDVTRPGR